MRNAQAKGQGRKVTIISSGGIIFIAFVCKHSCYRMQKIHHIIPLVLLLFFPCKLFLRGIIYVN
ncbi:putative membrane protein [Glaesserella parasuis H465]|nr:putative membrane protein [Glaesserella parasuis H465]